MLNVKARFLSQQKPWFSGGAKRRPLQPMLLNGVLVDFAVLHDQREILFRVMEEG